MNDFDFDALQKKRIAQGAKHKVGRRSGCTLPSDSLTEAQKRKLNGPVVTLKLDEPMSWKDFKALPEDKRRLYAEHIKELYNPSWKQWGQMFHTHPNTVRQHFIRYTITDARGWGASTTRADRARWDAFCNGVVGGRPGITPKEAEQPTTVASTRIKDLREKAGLTQAELAERFGMQASTIRECESGHGNLTEETLQRIANGLSSAIAKVNTATETADDTVEPVHDAVETRAATIEHFEIGIRAERWEDVFELVGRMPLPEMATIRVWRLQEERPTCDGPVTENALPTVSAPATGV